MASHAKELMEQYRAFVRKVIVAKPSASLMEIQKQLVNNNLPKLHVDTISKIRNKLITERVHKMNRVFLSMRLGEQKDVREEILAHAWGILLQPEDNNQKMAAMKLILQEEHEWTKLLILVGILDQGDKRAEGLIGKEKEFPEETFDTIVDAIKNNQLHAKVGSFKYLPENSITINPINEKQDAKPADNQSGDRGKFFTTIPLKHDRSFAIPPKHA